MALTETASAPANPKVGRTADPCVMVIFGVTGDLTRRKLIPALYNLASQHLLSREFAVVGIGRNPMTTEEARQKLSEDFKQFATGPVDPDLWEWFSRRLHYLPGNFDDPKIYNQLKETLEKVEKDHGTHGNVFFYLATAPDYFCDIVRSLANVGLMKEENGHWRRVIIEKPFGHDLDSARALNQHLLKVVSENQIYRIDHYLGKETVQNILAFRFANGIFEPIWNRRYIDNVQISVAETVGVEKRGDYYDKAGALRDMVPNHIMQLITLTAMEPPISFEANAVRDEQAKILHAIQPFSSEDVLSKTIRGQYGEGTVDGQRVPAYRELVEEVLAEVLAELPRLERSCISRDGFVFVTAPRTRTPAHSDPEHNFYLQVSGTNGPPVATGYPPTPPPDRRTRLQRYALGLVAALFMIAATISLVTISPRKPIALTRPAQRNRRSSGRGRTASSFSFPGSTIPSTSRRS